MNILIDAVKQGIADKTLRSDIDPQETAILLWGFSLGVIQLVSLKGAHFRDQHGINLEKLQKTGMDFMVRSINNNE